ncbi:TetR family transcriptional regulator [Eggerthellaceae bacterium zg-893]|nr:TetR family transcriptional regulator [Eggerthellaceae bacterium zg-893]
MDDEGEYPNDSSLKREQRTRMPSNDRSAQLQDLCKDLFRPRGADGKPIATTDFATRLLQVIRNLNESRAIILEQAKGSDRAFWDAFERESGVFFACRISRGMRALPSRVDSLYAQHLAGSFARTIRWWFEQPRERDEMEVLRAFSAISGLRLFAAQEPGGEGKAAVNEDADTKTSIKLALGSVLAEKPLDQVSVNEVARAASVSRSTFYSHFHDVYEAYIELIRDSLYRTSS